MADDTKTDGATTNNAAADTKTTETAKTDAAQTATDTAAADKATADKAAADAAKTGERKTAADTGTKTESKVPDKYELKVPEGGDAYVDPADLATLETMARKAGWSNEDAQAALEEHVATIHAQAERFAADTKADTEYGGDKLTESQRLANIAIDRIRPKGHARRESFQRFLGRGGAGNHIEVVSFLADLGKLMGEDSPAHSRSTQPGSSEDLTDKLYDHPDSVALRKRAG
jgi:hypothetical protein